MRDMPNGREDAHLARAWSRGDPTAARQVVEEYGPAMLRVALALCPRTEDAEEIVQDALLLALRSARAFDPDRGTLRAWLVGVTVNRARQVRRGMSRYRVLLARMGREPYEVPPKAAAGNGDLALARRRLARLPTREREAFFLVEIEELSSVEAGRVMGIADSTVRVLAARARARLQEDVEPVHTSSIRAEGRQ